MKHGKLFFYIETMFMTVISNCKILEVFLILIQLGTTLRSLAECANIFKLRTLRQGLPSIGIEHRGSSVKGASGTMSHVPQ